MQTSYFSKAGTHPNAIAISNSVKGFEHIRIYTPLVPPWWLVKQLKLKETTPEEFAEIYRSQLAKLQPVVVRAALGEDAILLCWDFCHRRIAAEWLESGCGIKIPEMDYTPVDQRGLF
jgi:hypothetical protein